MAPVQFIGSMGLDKFPGAAQFEREHPQCVCTRVRTDEVINSSLSQPQTANPADIVEFGTKIIEMRKSE